MIRALVIITAFQLVSLAQHVVLSFPSGAGSCASGTKDITSAHASSTQGNIENGGYEVFFDKLKLTSGINLVNTGGAIVTLKASGESFRGFLVRMETNDFNNNLGFVPTKADAFNVQILSTEPNSFGVSCEKNSMAATHTNNIDKLQSEFFFFWDDGQSDINIDVIVVKVNSGGESVWYYSTYNLRTVSTEEPSQYPTILKEEKSNSPTQIPLEKTNFPSLSKIPSSAPSSFPSNIASSFPSNIPSSFPSSFPSDLASEVPSSGPSNIASSFPSKMPSSFPSSFPSKVSSASPSMSPSVMKSNSPSKKPILTPFPTISTIFCTNEDITMTILLKKMKRIFE